MDAPLFEPVSDREPLIPKTKPKSKSKFSGFFKKLSDTIRLPFMSPLDMHKLSSVSLQMKPLACTMLNEDAERLVHERLNKLCVIPSSFKLSTKLDSTQLTYSEPINPAVQSARFCSMAKPTALLKDQILDLQTRRHGEVITVSRVGTLGSGKFCCFIDGETKDQIEPSVNCVALEQSQQILVPERSHLSTDELFECSEIIGCNNKAQFGKLESCTEETAFTPEKALRMNYLIFDRLMSSKLTVGQLLFGDTEDKFKMSKTMSRLFRGLFTVAIRSPDIGKKFLDDATRDVVSETPRESKKPRVQLKEKLEDWENDFDFGYNEAGKPISRITKFSKQEIELLIEMGKELKEAEHFKDSYVFCGSVKLMILNLIESFDDHTAENLSVQQVANSVFIALKLGVDLAAYAYFTSSSGPLAGAVAAAVSNVATTTSNSIITAALTRDVDIKKYRRDVRTAMLKTFSDALKGDATVPNGANNCRVPMGALWENLAHMMNRSFDDVLVPLLDKCVKANSFFKNNAYRKYRNLLMIIADTYLVLTDAQKTAYVSSMAAAAQYFPQVQPVSDGIKTVSTALVANGFRF
eukprot:gnl/Spiro4/18044_TR9634_c0_g1_i2.p1 gnl/Spiro4/18044_TR9634_c0_g1~~gnl/Spiro4/18044_TR9634_c0_g1_i2.p1  ORF type:complete len:638 (+),score=204.04 gnl/Spiro4/18044_TR9634_c0_g1_i2:177-1916(+)